MEKSMANPCVNSSVPWCRRSHLFSHLVLEIPSQIANKARYHDAVKNTCYITDLWIVLQKWCHDAVECHDAVDDIIWKRGASTHFSGRNTLSATLHSTDSSYPEIPRWLKWKKCRGAKNHAAWCTDSSCSITVSNDFATKQNYHLALFTFKGVSSTKLTACLFFEEIICTAAMPARSAMTAFTCSSDCNLKTLSVTRTMSEPSSSAVTLPMTRCTLPSHMLKRIACCNWQKASTRKCLGNCASTATTFSFCSMMTLSSPCPSQRSWLPHLLPAPTQWHSWEKLPRLAAWYRSQRTTGPHEGKRSETPCVSWRSGGTAPALRENRKKSERRSADVKVWRCRSADVKVWRCRSAGVRVWRCRSANVRVSRCRSADVKVWRCRSADVKVWRSRSAGVRVWRCRSADVKVWRSRSAGVRVWRCRSASVRVWRCRSADVKVWRCRSAGVRVWRCRSADVRVWRCRSADVKVWRCSITAAFFTKNPSQALSGKTPFITPFISYLVIIDILSYWHNII